jgi:hypothetical protein
MRVEHDPSPPAAFDVHHYVRERIAGLDLPWGIDLIAWKGEPNPAVCVVADLLRRAGKPGARTARGR